MSKPHLDRNHYHTYPELTQLLRDYEAAFPNLARLESIGKSYEGRDIWCMEITNRALGNPDEKPGYYIDANIHAGEVTGCATVLYTIDYLLSRYGQDEDVARLLDEQTFYLIPRVSPDGAERYLTTPYMLRSSVRYYPFAEERDGLQPEDVNGDGHITQMRVPDEDGEWKVSRRDKRLMVPRRPDEFGGQYYRLYAEGTIKNFDGFEVKPAPPRWGLDLNRNFPISWEPEAKQSGAGPYPLSEPETRALAEFLLKHKNIWGLQSYHTTTGIILRPSTLRPDDKMNKKDLTAFKAIGKIGEEITGYPCASIHDGFAYDRQNPIKGVFLDWTYDHLGLLGYSTELWDLRVRAGLERVSFLVKDPNVEEDGLKILAWMDRELAGEGFVPWTPFDHPQLGHVEIGGFQMKTLLQNCPPHLLPQETHKNAMFTLRHAMARPLLRIQRASAEHLGDGLFRLEVIVTNKGYLPTNVTEQAKQMKAVQDVRVELDLPEDAELVMGKPREEIGQLDGRIVGGPGFYPGNQSTQRERRLEWVVRAPSGGELKVTAASERAGTHRAAVRLAR